MTRVHLGKCEQEKIITTEEVKCLLLNYNIGKKPLAKLLGWGETTIIRYIEGDIPTCEYSQKLIQIMEDPKYYYDILIKNQDKLTNVAFKKSRKAVLGILMQSKINLIAQYIINKANGDITAKRIQSTLFYAQVLSLGINGKELFDELYSKNYSNIPYPSVFESMKKNGIKVIDINLDFIDRKEREILDIVYETLDWYGAKFLNALNHMENNEFLLKDYSPMEKTVPMDLLKSEYRNIFQNYNIAHIRDFPLYLQKRMREVVTRKDIIKKV